MRLQLPLRRCARALSARDTRDQVKDALSSFNSALSNLTKINRTLESSHITIPAQMMADNASARGDAIPTVEQGFHPSRAQMLRQLDYGRQELRRFPPDITNASHSAPSTVPTKREEITAEEFPKHSDDLSQSFGLGTNLWPMSISGSISDQPPMPNQMAMSMHAPRPIHAPMMNPAPILMVSQSNFQSNGPVAAPVQMPLSPHLLPFPPFPPPPKSRGPPNRPQSSGMPHYSNKQYRYFATNCHQGAEGSPRGSESPSNEPIQMMPQPCPTQEYMVRSLDPPLKMEQPMPLLVIADLNGTLLVRPNKKNSTRFMPRPGLGRFLRKLIKPKQPKGYDTIKIPKHKLMIWTSAQAKTTDVIVPQLIPVDLLMECAAVWARDKCGIPRNLMKQRVQVYKRLNSVWQAHSIQVKHPDYHCGHRWDQGNTILIDDSPVKAASEPFNLVKIPQLTVETLKEEETNRTGVLSQVLAYIQEASWYTDVSCFIRHNPFVVGGRWVQPEYEEGEVPSDGEASVEVGAEDDFP